MTTPALLTPSKASSMFSRTVKGCNLMTPTFVAFYPLFNGCAEISKGRGLEDEPIFGVTVVRNNQHRTDEGKVFWSRKAAEEYIDRDLRGGV